MYHEKTTLCSERKVYGTPMSHLVEIKDAKKKNKRTGGDRRNRIIVSKKSFFPTYNIFFMCLQIKIPK